MHGFSFTVQGLILFVSLTAMGYFALWFHRQNRTSLSGFQVFLFCGVTIMLLVAQSLHALDRFGFTPPDVSAEWIVRFVQTLCLFWVVLSLYHFHRLAEIVKESRLFRTLTDGVFVLEPGTGSIQEVNPTGLEQLGLPLKQVKHTRFQDLSRGLLNGDWHKFVRTLRSHGTTLTTEGTLVPAEEPPFPVEASSRYVEREHRILVVTRDITRRKRIQKRLRRNETHDELTGLPNRKYFRTYLQNVLDRTEPENRSRLLMVLFDLNRFKDINDAHGHRAGDRVLQVVANRLVSRLGSGNTVARLGTDEFALLVEDRSAEAEPREIVATSLDTLQQPIRVGSKTLTVQARAGFVVGKPRYERAESMVRHANLALRRAKNRRSRSFAKFCSKMHRSRERYLDQKQKLLAAFREDQFELRYQPILDLVSNRPLGVEALIRWRHPARGLLSPSDFLPTIKKTQMVRRLDNHALEEACRQGQRWHEMATDGERLTVSVNFSPTNFLHDGVADHIREIIRRQEFRPEWLHLELLETDVMHKSELNQLSLTKLKNTGIKLLLDDFGTGYSSFEHLHRLPVDILKIDRGFVSNIETDRVAFDLVKTIVDLARNLDKKVIAEGIESKRQMELLREMGCRYGQGFYLSKPLSAGEIDEMIESTSPPRMAPEKINAVSAANRGPLSGVKTDSGARSPTPLTNF